MVNILCCHKLFEYGVRDDCNGLLILSLDELQHVYLALLMPGLGAMAEVVMNDTALWCSIKCSKTNLHN